MPCVKLLEFQCVRVYGTYVHYIPDPDLHLEIYSLNFKNRNDIF
jgi:hypothetical protein